MKTKHRFKSINLTVITNKKISDRVKKIPTATILNYQISVNIWDIKRFFDIESSKNKKETLLIDFLEEFNTLVSSLPGHISFFSYQSIFRQLLVGIILARLLWRNMGARLLGIEWFRKVFWAGSRRQN